MGKLILSLFLAGMLWCSPAEANRRSALVINAALEALQKDNPQKALELLEGPLQTSSPNISAFLIAGNAYIELDKTKQALALYEKGLKIYPKDIKLLQNKAITLYYLEKYNEAGEMFLDVAKKQHSIVSKDRKADQAPEWYKTQYQAGICFYKAEKYGAAQRALLPLSKQNAYKEWLDVQQVLAHSYLAQEKWKQAEQVLTAYLAVNKQKKKIWILLAEVHIRQNKLKTAAATMQVAKTIAPPSVNECMRLARLYLQVNSPLLAADSINTCPKPLTVKQYDLLAIAQEKSGHINLASHSLTEALKKEKSAKRSLALGKLYYRHEEYKKAIQPLTIAAKNKKHSGLAHYLLGQCYLECGDEKVAEKMFVEASKNKRIRLNAKSALRLLKQKQKIREDKNALSKIN